MISNQEREVAEQVIKLHDGKSFSLLQELLVAPPGEESENTITEGMYQAVCEKIKRELGAVSRMEFIDCLRRSESRLTLWRVRYSSSKDEVFWAVGFDSRTDKVKDVLVNW